MMAEIAPINFTRGVPADESLPVDELIEAAREALATHRSGILQYGPSTGFPPFRDWIAEWLGVAPNRLLLANGSLQLIEFVCLELLSPGDVVFTESPTYDRTLTLLRRHGAKVVGIPLEPDGPDIAALELALERNVPKLFYTIPDFQNPAGATCSATKRRRIVELADKYGFLLLEDAPYRLLRYRGTPEPTLFDLAPERTLHMSSFTKLIAPGIRTGFLAGNEALVARLAKIAEDTYISPGYLAEGVAYEWCRRGSLPGQIEKLKRLYSPRLDACLAAIDRHLPGVDATRPDGGFFISVILPPDAMTTAVRTAARERKLNLADGLAFFPDGGGERFLRLPFCALTPEEIEDGIQRLAATIADVREAA
jgi:DNA-binding transcriptional MocR family regulator